MHTEQLSRFVHFNRYDLGGSIKERVISRACGMRRGNEEGMHSFSQILRQT